EVLGVRSGGNLKQMPIAGHLHEGIGELVDARIFQKLPLQVSVQPTASCLHHRPVLVMHLDSGVKTSMTDGSGNHSVNLYARFDRRPLFLFRWEIEQRVR